MRTSQAIRRASVLGTVVAVFMAVGAEFSLAGAATWICVPETAGTAVTSGGSSGECKAAYTKVELPPTAEMTVLNQILPHIKYTAEGVDAKPTIQFSGVNLQIINGEGKTSLNNGEGNLVMGYDESPGTQTGSHDLILGTSQSYTSYGGILAGESNKISSPFASVTGGEFNTASGEGASISGGRNSEASGVTASVSGGSTNKASELSASVSGGQNNTASFKMAWVGGGYKNTASYQTSSVSGGEGNTASGAYSSVLGGFKNAAETWWTTVYGGKEVKATKEYEVAG
jgi:hypothetical protein